MIRSAATAALALMLAAGPATAQGQLSQLQISVDRTLRLYDIDVDVRTLSPAELSAVHTIAGSSRPESQKRGLIKSAVGNGYRLRDLFFN